MSAMCISISREMGEPSKPLMVPSPMTPSSMADRIRLPIASGDSRGAPLFRLGRRCLRLWVGANLRDSIENGLKTCKKCILILSPNFFANNGWTKKEFDSIFTREILEEKQLVLPVWHGVTKEMVYAYSPSLLNIKGLDWEKLGEEEVCRQLVVALLEGHPQIG
jgi:TIR domain